MNTTIKEQAQKHAYNFLRLWQTIELVLVQLSQFKQNEFDRTSGHSSIDYLEEDGKDPNAEPGSLLSARIKRSANQSSSLGISCGPSVTE